MSRNLFAFLLSELKTVRVICQNTGCGSVVEVPIELLEGKYEFGKCPVCGKLVQNPASNHIVELARAIQAVAASKDRVLIEFVLPQDK